MKDQFTALLSDVIQHQVDLQSGFETFLHQVEQAGDKQSAKALKDQVEHFNTRVTALVSALGNRWPGLSEV